MTNAYPSFTVDHDFIKKFLILLYLFDTNSIKVLKSCNRFCDGAFQLFFYFYKYVLKNQFILNASFDPETPSSTVFQSFETRKQNHHQNSRFDPKITFVQDRIFQLIRPNNSSRIDTVKLIRLAILAISTRTNRLGLETSTQHKTSEVMQSGFHL